MMVEEGSTVQATPRFAKELSLLVAEATTRPVRAYALRVADDSVVFDRPPRGAAEAGRAWERVWPVAKPDLVSLDVDPSPETFTHAEPWLDILRRYPEAFDNLDVLDDLVLVFGPLSEELDPELDGSLVQPLLARASAIVAASLDTHADRKVEWVFPDNRPVLRLICMAALRLERLGQQDEAALLFEWMLRLNPNDNQGHRSWLMNHYLETGNDAKALDLAAAHGSDSLVEMTFGKALGLWRTGRRPEAEDALRAPPPPMGSAPCAPSPRSSWPRRNGTPTGWWRAAKKKPGSIACACARSGRRRPASSSSWPLSRRPSHRGRSAAVNAAPAPSTRAANRGRRSPRPPPPAVSPPPGRPGRNVTSAAAPPAGRRCGRASGNGRRGARARERSPARCSPRSDGRTRSCLRLPRSRYRGRRVSSESRG